MELIADVRQFLDGLRSELPELFRGPPARPAPLEPGRSVFHARVAHYAPLMGVTPNKIFLKEQRTLWGSCSARGNLNFNRRLLQAPPEVLDYVVVHELAHLKHMNHSKRFWAFVEAHCPDWKARRKWLRVNSALLA